MLYSLRNLKKVYGDRTVLNIDNLDIPKGKVYTLIGPNGAGKTTLLKVLAFLDKPSIGEVCFANSLVEYSEKKLFRLRRRVVLLDQNPIMFTGSVWSNVEFGLKVRKVPLPERKKRILEALELVGMGGFAEYNAGDLSGGETKRVALARALVFKPDVLLCDEPTANVDNENQEIILTILKTINRTEKTSVIFSTHYLSQGQQLADHTLLLQNGVLSDLASENIFRIVVVDRREDRMICQLTDKLTLSLPDNVLPAETHSAKLYIDPRGILLNPHDSYLANGCTLSGQLIGLNQENGEVRITVNVGLKLILILPLEQYRLQQPCLGDMVQVFIPHDAIVSK
jgi:tungstate transport system ATP-binding protein